MTGNKCSGSILKWKETEKTSEGRVGEIPFFLPSFLPVSKIRLLQEIFAESVAR